ncbi:gliding motility-associated C-terminal domain-containing protein [Lewinella sp. IMCC34183]|uniref:T9SS type B sorting domain-containing protein n=1 Tax=Lewinella sp. IMCC34183 TaxID=2248762 RepID=UPI0018E50355|nr:gliding motility-associated C-terminal domain-containing protein [Lewinella sp. IMCC34183]
MQASTSKVNTLGPKAVCTSDVGTITGFKDLNMESNSFGRPVAGSTVAFAARPDTIFLCRNDAFTVDFLNGSEDLSGDPNPDTRPGIAYAVYDCPPTVTGTTVADVNQDPCHADPNNPLYPNLDGTLNIFPPANYFGATPNYDLIVDNQDTPSAAEIFGGPVVLYVAPVTIDSLDLTEGTFRDESGFNGNEGCTLVGVNQTFAVAYLNPIRVDNPSQSGSDCSGSFTVMGGVSELRNTADYAITIRSTTGQLGTVTSGPARHGDVVSYTVPGPGDYTINVEDAVSCAGNTTVTHAVTACAPVSNVTLDVTPTPISCAGEQDGELTVAATGGTPTYVFTITRTNPATPPITDNGSTVADGEPLDFNELPGGQYTVTVTDANGATATSNIEIEAGNVSVGIEVADGFDCFDDAQGGTLEAVIFDGNNPIAATGYTFLWSNGETTQTITDLSPGTYAVTATNTATGCATTDSENFRAPNRLLINNSSLNSDAATCSGVSDGTVNIPISGGTQDANGEYAIGWSDGVTTNGSRIARTDLLPNAYSVTVTDVNGCQDSTNFTIAAVKTLIVNSDVTDISCFGDGDGSISVTGSFDNTGATPDYPFEAALLDNDGNQVFPYRTVPDQGRTPVVFDNLGPGTYRVSLRDQDSDGCEISRIVTVVEPALLEIDTVNVTDFGCPDEFGTAAVDVTGGTAPYTYRFKNDSLPDPIDTLMTFDSLVVDTNFIGDLQPDTNYVVIVTDANGCIDSTTFRISSPPRAAIAPIATDFVSCTDSQDGQLVAEVTPPQGETVTNTAWYRLNNDGTIGEQVDIGLRTTADLSVGFYLFEATLSNECVSQAIGEVASPGLVALDSVALVPPVCLGDANGSITVYPSGGTGPYRYDWSADNGSSSSPTLTNLTAGTYSVTITDANNCQPPFDTTFVLEEPVGITGSFTNLQGVSCPDSTTADGAATFSARFSNDSTGLFDFYWSSGDTILQQASSTVDNLTRGAFSVTVTDGLCPQVFTDTIASPEDFVITPTTVDVSCFDAADGSLSVDVTGATPGYTFEWIGRTETGPSLDSLDAGSYPLVVTDSRGCVADTLQAEVLEPDELVLSINEALTTPSVTCAGDSNGVLAVFVSSTNNNPLADSPYSWSQNVDDRDDNVAVNLNPDTYSVTVTDNRGCQDSLQYTIVDPQPITFSVDPIPEPLCFGQMTPVTLDTVFGGQGTSLSDYSYTLNNDGFLLPVDQPGSTFAGEVVVSVFDAAGCRTDQTVTVNQPEEIQIDLDDRLIVDLGDSLQQLDPIVTPPDNYTYLWTPDNFLSSDSIRNPYVFPRGSENYTLTVTNPNGCEAEENIFVEVDANRNVYIPNAFSPNRDGRNDDFRVYACQGVIGVSSVQIYNRWGGLVYEDSEIPANCLDGTLLWDGMTPDGKSVGTGVYVYVVEVVFLDNVSLLYRGDISVVR